MARLRLKVRLNEGRVGIPLKKLAGLTEEIHKFLKMACQDVDLTAEAESWIAENFENGSVCFAIKNVDSVPEPASRAFHKLAGRIMRFHRGAADDYSDIRRATLGQYARIAKVLDMDERVSLGLIDPEESESGPVEWHDLTRQTLSDLEEYLERPSAVEYYGGVQGVVYSLAKEADKPHFTIRVQSTRELVKCYYKESLYGRVIELLKEKDAVVYVAGMIKANMVTREIEHIVAGKLKSCEEFSDQELERFFGCAPGMTGALSTEEFISGIRKDAH